MKKALGGQKFTSDLAAQSTGHQWIEQQPNSFFAAGIEKLVPRRENCLNVLGGHNEK